MSQIKIYIYFNNIFSDGILSFSELKSPFLLFDIFKYYNLPSNFEYKYIAFYKKMILFKKDTTFLYEFYSIFGFETKFTLGVTTILNVFKFFYFSYIRIIICYGVVNFNCWHFLFEWRYLSVCWFEFLLNFCVFLCKFFFFLNNWNFFFKCWF